MAATKKATTAEPKAVKTKAVKEAAKPAKETAAKAKAAKAVKETTKETAVKKTTTGRATKSSVNVNIEFDGKSYTPDALVQIAKDVWKYDLNRKASEFKTVDLYVKPEEGMAYYVINGTVDGSFVI